jgi:hypothetical protein
MVILIARKNVERLQSLLATEADPERVKQIYFLLDHEERRHAFFSARKLYEDGRASQPGI